MLWYKAWMETRTRFLVALTGITTLCAWRVYDLYHLTPGRTPPGAYSFILGSVHELLILSWLLAVTLLLMGGLVQEKHSGSASFTLAMPVTRARLMQTRIAAGFLEAAALIAIPWTAACIVAFQADEGQSPMLGLFYAMVTISGGAVFAGAALLVSSLVEGTYTAPTISGGVAILCRSAPRSWQALNPLAFMAGGDYLRTSNVVTDHWPWGHAASCIAAGAALAWLSVKVVERRDF